MTRCKQCKIKVETPYVAGIFSFCGIEHAKDYAFANIDKGRKKIISERKKSDAKKKREFKLNDLKKQLKLTQSSFNKLRKLQELKWFKDRGLEPECISCGKKNMDWCCGHLKTVGAHSELRFDELNTYLQCNMYCNNSLSGNINGNKTTRGYITGLADRFGESRKDEIIEYLESKPHKKWTCSELVEMRKDINKKIKLMLE